MPHITSRLFSGDADFWRIRQLSLDTYPITGPGFNWDFRRHDGSRFYNPTPEVIRDDWFTFIRLWETETGDLAGVAHWHGPGDFYLEIHPAYRNQIEADMVAWSIDHLAGVDPETHRRQIMTEVYEYDAPRKRILERLGFEKLPDGGVHRKMRLLGQPLPPRRPVEEGYTLRAIDAADWADCQRVADLLNASFHRDFHNAAEFYQFAHHAPGYRGDLHLVYSAPDGSFAAHAALCYDDQNCRGLYEPVCTHPAHVRKGLAQALMIELLYRAVDLGAREITVETGDMIPANALYDSLGFTEVYKSFTWRKLLD